MQIEKRRMETLNTKGGTTGKVFGMIDMIYLVFHQHRVWNWILTVIIVITVIIYDASSSSESIKKIINSKSSFWSGQPSNITRRQWSWVPSAQSITTTGGGWIHIVLTYQLWIIWLTGHPLLQATYTGVRTTVLWNIFFPSFLAKTKREQSLLSHIHGEIWLRSLQYWLWILSIYFSKD